MKPENYKPRILVVDDDTSLLELLVDTLATIGYGAIGVPGGVEALQKLNEQKFDLMVTDIKMPDVDGLQLLRKVRRHYSQMPVLFITGFAEPNIIGQASPDGFLAKPFRISQIEELIENALQRDPADFPAKLPRVLIVDEDEEFRSSLSDALSYSQCLPFHVPHAEAAMRELESGAIDAMIADYQLSGTNGASLVMSMKKRYPDLLTVLIVESQSSVDSLQARKASGADAFLSKPFKTSELLELLSQHGIGPGETNN